LREFAARPRELEPAQNSRLVAGDGRRFRLSDWAPYGEPVSTSIAVGGAEFTIIASEFAQQ
jgi:hypothetical protein